MTRENRNVDRRSFLALSAMASVGALSLTGGKVATPVRRRLLQMNGYPVNAETPLELLTSYITPNDLFFVRHHWNPVQVDASSWRLDVDGDVERPSTYSLQDLKAMSRTSATCVLQCAGNGRALFSPAVPGLQWTYGALGNARWTGVSVRELLERSGLKGSAKHLHTFGADSPPGKVPPFHRSLEIEKVLSDGIIAYEMNDEPLPHLHGGPARLVVPGWAGDHWMKWLRRITAASKPQSGFYMDVGYRYPVKPGVAGVPVKPEEMTPVTELFVKSNITTAPRKTRPGTESEIRGFALSGAPGIARVEWSDDDGLTWREARLDEKHDRFSWRLFAFRWTPRKPGKSMLMVRATDDRGSVQPRQPNWNQSGYLFNGWHAVAIEVDG